MQEFVPDVLESSVHLFQVADVVQWRFMGTPSISGDRSVSASNPPSGAMIYYYLAEYVDEDLVSLEVFDGDGKRMAELDVAHEAGLHALEWSTRGGSRFRRGPRRRPVTPGVYTVELSIGDEVRRQVFQVLADPIAK